MASIRKAGPYFFLHSSVRIRRSDLFRASGDLLSPGPKSITASHLKRIPEEGHPAGYKWWFGYAIVRLDRGEGERDATDDEKSGEEGKEDGDRE
jgi:hypothetical protein